MQEPLQTIDFHLESLLQSGEVYDFDIKNILYDLAYAGKRIQRLIQKTHFEKLENTIITPNASGDDVKPLDILSNDIFKLIMSKTSRYAIFASEEEETLYYPENAKNGDYILAVDPLDGSSNLDVNVSVGTIFSVFKVDKTKALNDDQLNRRGTDQIMGGYIIYGNSTELVYTAGQGVHRFVYDVPLGEFIQVDSSMKYATKHYCYSLNESHTPDLYDPLNNYINTLKAEKVTARYVGSLVADFHRNLIKGGIYIYPETKKNAKGKLRLLYEAFPLAFLSEQANGAATNGKDNIMELVVADPHEKTPLYIGSKSLLDKYSTFLNKEEVSV